LQDLTPPLQAGEFILHGVGGNMRQHGRVRLLQWRT